MKSDSDTTTTTATSFGGPVEIALNTTLPRIVYNNTIFMDEEIGVKEAIAISALTEMRIS